MTEFYITKLGSNRKTCNHFFKIQMHIRFILKFSEKYKCSGIAFFSPELQIYFWWAIMFKNNWATCFTFSISYSVLPFHFNWSLITPISPSFIFFNVLSQVFIKCSRWICGIRIGKRTCTNGSIFRNKNSATYSHQDRSLPIPPVSKAFPTL